VEDGTLQLIQKTVTSFNKQFGDDSAATLAASFGPDQVKGFIPTGNLAIDWCIGRPGFPIGRVSEIAGPYSSGKSTILAQTIGLAQAQGVVCILFDTEHSYNETWAKLYKVQPDELILVKPEHLEQTFDQMIFIVNLIKKERSTTPMFIAVDSISAVPASAELAQEDSTEGKQRALHAKIISEGLRKLTNLIWDENIAVVFVSQMKDNPAAMFGGKSKLGGHAIEFHAALLLETKKLATKKKDSVKAEKDAGGEVVESAKAKTIGQIIQIQCVKNKFVPPFRTRTFDLFFDEGIRPYEIAIDFMADKELLDWVRREKGWYVFDGVNHRKDELASKLTPDVLETIYETLKIRPKVIA